MASVLLTPFTVNGSFKITLRSVFVQGIRVLDTLSTYIYIMNSCMNALFDMYT